MEPNNNGQIRVQPAQLQSEEHEESMEGMSMPPPAFQLKGADDGDPEENNNDGSGSGGAGGAGGGADSPLDGGGSGGGSVQMMAEEEEEAVQAKMASMNPPAFSLGAGTPAQMKTADGLGGEDSGSGVTNDVMGKMESTIGHDFSNVNIHTNDSGAKDMGALAYTQGSDVHFAPGQFQPDTQSGQELLGHELTHVKQQSEGRVEANTKSNTGMPVNNDKGLEGEADQMGAKAAQAKLEGAETLQMKGDISLNQDSGLESEADAMGMKAAQMKLAEPAQMKEEEEEALQAKMAPAQMKEEEEEALQAKMAPAQMKEEEEEALQAKMAPAQMKEEEALQAKMAPAQMKEEEEEALQAKMAAAQFAGQEQGSQEAPTIDAPVTDGPEAEAATEEEAPAAMPDETVALDSGTFDPSEAMASWIDSGGNRGVDVRVSVGDIAAGTIKIKKSGETYETIGRQTSAINLNGIPFASAMIDSGFTPVLLLEITGGSVGGFATLKAGDTVLDYKGIFQWIRDNTEANGLAGFDNFGETDSITNEIIDGSLNFMVNTVPIRVGGWMDATASFGFNNRSFVFSADGVIDVPNLGTTTLRIEKNAEGQIVGSVDLAVEMENISGNLHAEYNNGIINIEGEATYTSDKLSGTIHLMVTDANTARNVAVSQLDPSNISEQTIEDQQIGMVEGAEVGPRALAGWGELDFSFTDWMTGKAKVIVDNEGHVTVQGEITPPGEVELFPQRDWIKELPRMEARAMYGIPMVGNIFVFANIGLDLMAKLGPAKIYDIKAEGTYSTDPAIHNSFSLGASLNMSAFAGVRLRAEGGAGVELMDHDIKVGIGINALAGIQGYVDARPTIGYRETDANSEGEFFIDGHMEIAAQPFLGLSGDLFVELDSPWWSPAPDEKWTWPIGELTYPLPGAFGIGADMDYVVGSGEWPEVQFGEVDFSADKFMTDLMNDHVPKGGETDAEAAGSFTQEGQTGEGAGGTVVDQSGGDGAAQNAQPGTEGANPALAQQQQRSQEDEGAEGQEQTTRNSGSNEQTVGEEPEVKLEDVDVQSRENFSMNGEAHTLTVDFDDTKLAVLMASNNPDDILKKIGDEIDTHDGVLPQPLFLSDLKGLKTAVSSAISASKLKIGTEVQTLRTAKKYTEISQKVKDLQDALITTIKGLLAAISNKHAGLKDFTYSSFDLGDHYTKIQNVLVGSLEKHVGGGKSGDGHACGAYAAEYVLGWYANQVGMKPQLHKTKVSDSKRSIKREYDALVEFRDTHSYNYLNTEPDYTDKYGITMPVMDKAKETLDWCEECLTNPANFLTAHSFNGKTLYKLFDDEVKLRILNESAKVATVKTDYSMELGDPSSIRAQH